MWTTYWKRFPITQGLILTVCALMKFYFGRSWDQVAGFFFVMQLGGLAGAWWGTRLARKAGDQDRKLPLDKG